MQVKLSSRDLQAPRWRGGIQVLIDRTPLYVRLSLANESWAWTIEISRTAEKQIKKLDKVTQGMIVRFLRDRLRPAENPRQFGKPLQGAKGGLWRYRIGDYRLICDLQDEKITVLVLRVGHRKDVYR